MSIHASRRDDRAANRGEGAPSPPVERAAELAAAGAERADREGRIAPETVRAIVAAGFPRHFVPVRWGGRGGTFAELQGAVAEIGRGCASAAWFASLTATLGRMAGYLPNEGQRQVWRDGPDIVVVGSLAPAGTVARAGQGWRVHGTWPLVSFVELSDWALVVGRTGSSATEQRFFAVPRSAYRVERTWSNAGMRATASHTLVLPEAYVPRELSFARADLEAGAPVDSDAPCHAVPLRAVTGLSFAAPVLGSAQGALEAWTSLLRWRMTPAAEPPLGWESVTNRVVLGRAAGEIQTARLVLEHVAESADRERPTPLATAAAARDCALATERLVAATDELMRAAGTPGLSAGGDFERRWRDIHSAASHGTLRFATKAVAYADLVLDNPDA